MSHYDERRHPVLKILLDRLEARAVAINCLGRRKGQSDARLAELRHEKELDQERINTLHARVGKLHDKLGWRNQPEEDPTEVGPEVLGEPLVVSGWAPGTAPEGCAEAKPAPSMDGIVSRAAYDGVVKERDDALERGVAVAKQHADLRLAAGCAEGQSLERRIDELMRGHFVQISERRRKERDEARAEVSAIHRREDGLRVKLDEAVSQRDDALDRHKQAHDRAMALHVVIDQAVHELREAMNADATQASYGTAMREAVHLLTRDEGVAGEAKSEVEVLRAQCAAVHPAEDMRLWRELAGCEGEQTLANRLEILAKERADWEAEALERAQNQTDLENRMDEAAKLLDGAFAPGPQGSVRSRVDMAKAILARGEGADVTQAEAWEKTARGLNERIDQAVKVLESVEEPSVSEMEALGLLTTDCAGGEA